MPLSPALQRLYRGDFNYMSQEHQPDGTVIITLVGGSQAVGHRVHVRDLYGPNETVLSEEEISPTPPPHLKQRLDEAAGRG